MHSRLLNTLYFIYSTCYHVNPIVPDIHDNSKLWKHKNLIKNTMNVCLAALNCCDIDQSDTIGKIELIPSFVLSSNDTNCKNDIQ